MACAAAKPFWRGIRTPIPHARLARLDTDAEPGVAGRYGIRGIPTLIVFKGGRALARQSGALDAGRLVAWIESHI